MPCLRGKREKQPPRSPQKGEDLLAVLPGAHGARSVADLTPRMSQMETAIEPTMSVPMVRLRPIPIRITIHRQILGILHQPMAIHHLMDIIHLDMVIRHQPMAIHQDIVILAMSHSHPERQVVVVGVLGVV